MAIYLWVVTGGAGFIGSHIVERLAREGKKVVIVDTFLTGSRDNVDHLSGVYPPPWTASVTCDFLWAPPTAQVVVCDRLPWSLERGGWSVAGVFHLGQPSSTTLYRRNRGLVWEALRDMVEVCEFCTYYNAPLVFASTSSMYKGNPLPYREDMAVRAFDWYTEVKYWSERLMQVYAKQRGLRGVALRLFSVYGPREEHKRELANVVSQMIWASIVGCPFKIYGDGTQTRDFVFVEDVVDAFLAALRYLRELDAREGHFDVFNVGTGVETSFNELARLVDRVATRRRCKLTIEYVENPIAEYVERTCADITKIQDILGWRPRTPLEEGVERCFEYYRDISKKIGAWESRWVREWRRMLGPPSRI